MSTNELEMKIRELRQLQQLIEEAQAEAEGIRDVIKAHMGEREELRAGEYKITWKPVTSSRLDAAALRAALPEVAARFTRTSTARRFCVAGGRYLLCRYWKPVPTMCEAKRSLPSPPPRHGASQW